MGRVTVRRHVLRVPAHGEPVRREDTLAVEEPLELRVGGAPVMVTMRTPGDDIDLVHGWLLAEGVIRTPEDVRTARYCEGTDAADINSRGRNTYNVLDVTLREGVAPPQPRATMTTSACGVCGSASIEALRRTAPYDLRADDTVVSVDVLGGLPERLRAEQRVFDRTGGLHAAGLFDAAGAGVAVREDVGRHNALDKALGAALRAGRLPLRGHVVQVSGRASFELVQKAVLAGVPVLAAVSAPSSLAVDLAEESGLTLVGFSRNGSFTVYAHPARVAAAAALTMLGR